MERMIGAMIMMGVPGTQTGPGDPFYEAVAAGLVGNIALSDRNVRGGADAQPAESLRALIGALRDAAAGPFFVAVPQEGGSRSALGPDIVTPMPAAHAMGRGRAENTNLLAVNQGKELSALGITVNLAPVADFTANPSAGENQRGFGSDPTVVSRHVMAFARGMNEAGVIPVLKYFPGCGEPQGDGREGTDRWDSRTHLKPYVDSLQAGFPVMVMIGHARHAGLDRDFPAALSTRIVNDLLRVALYWDGVVISDDMQHPAIRGRYSLEESIRLALEAGVDMLFFGNSDEQEADLPRKVHAAILRLLDNGVIAKERIQQSWRRIRMLYEASEGADSVVDLPPPLVRIP
jgi:beta-N-acetylhexosaminidase